MLCANVTFVYARARDEILKTIVPGVSSRAQDIP